ncbi:hypothetical protein Tel_15355 [Candidatus Tenderia electrophaga]|jgi:hypothetical protein|uniref:Protein nucleotidyltransferase YdiU n=1 Tax=Candidatus Tenderia electrophaga TaxID=1748243 RepID=A0A0S2TGX6_9GAMM|nr:hypothetical protein Tel_15355 [Candidatus Tenderia electrophaga]
MKHSPRSLPLSNSFAALPDDFYSRVAPTPFQSEAALIHVNRAAVELLELDPACAQDEDFVHIFSGRRRLEQGAPIAMRYAGHQFGHFVPQLGDGRAIMLGETTNSKGEKWEIQLKGSGMTPYSRMGDGRAVLRSTLREYLCSEAMHGLGIPTTRALCIIGSDDKVYREQIERGAVLTRLAPSHVRFGSLEYFYYRNKHEQLKQLIDYVIEQHFPALADAEQPVLALLHEVISRTARLMAQWQAVGFCHGVMNSDNMSILGLTLDYGPFGFLEGYNPRHVCNHSDHQGRYAYDQQPEIGLWNLACLAQTLLPFMSEEQAKDALNQYAGQYGRHYRQLMAAKLGFEIGDETIHTLVERLLQHMQLAQTDFTRLFRELCNVERDSDAPHDTLRNMFVDREGFDAWLSDYRAALRQSAKPDAERQALMKRTNPKYVLRNYMAQIAIDKAERERDYSEIDTLMQIMQRPFDEWPQLEHYADPPPDWAGEIEVSCSS